MTIPQMSDAEVSELRLKVKERLENEELFSGLFRDYDDSDDEEWPEFIA